MHLLEEGYDAYLQGIPAQDNPYPEETYSFYYWIKGWEQWKTRNNQINELIPNNKIEQKQAK